MAKPYEALINEALAVLDTWVDEADANADIAERVALAWGTREERQSDQGGGL